MAIHLDVRHPSPVSALPRRGRRERHGFETLVTPVSVPEAPPSAFSPLKPISLGQVAVYGISVRDGATWAELLPPDGGRGFKTADVLGFLRDASHPDPGMLGQLRAAFRFTPVHAGGLDASGSHVTEVDFSLGDPLYHLEGHALDRVTHEERARSAAGLQAWVSGNLAVSGDRVMVRRPLMLQVHEWGGRLNVYSVETQCVGAYGVSSIRPDRARELCASIGRPFDDESMEEGLALFEAWTKGLETDDDVLLLAQRLPALVQSLAEVAAVTFGYRRALKSPDDVAPALARLSPWRLRGACGGIAMDEVVPALDACASALDGLRAAGVPLPPCMGVMEAVDRWYRPRAETIDAEDLRALAAMA